MPFLYFLEGLRRPFLDGLMQAITWLGEEGVALPLLLLFYWCVHKKVGLQLLFCTFLGAGVNSFLKLNLQIPRPWLRNTDFTIVESAREAATGFSFPSGHVQTAAGLYGVLMLWFKNKALKVIMALCVLLVAFSRMYLGVHTPADVLFSLLIGLIVVGISHVLFQRSEHSVSMGFLILFLLNAAFLLLMQFIPLVNPADSPIAHSLHKHAALAVGGSLALFLASRINGEHFRFETRASLPVQLIKLVLGLAIVLGLRMGLKPIFHALFANDIWADMLRYFVITLFGVMIWPMSFRHIERFYAKLTRK